MGFLANQKLRFKLLIALAPLALMVIVAALYSSIESKRIDTWYSDLITHDVTALQDLTAAQARANRFGLVVYKNIAEADRSRIRANDAELAQDDAEYHDLTQLPQLEGQKKIFMDMGFGNT